MGLFNLLFGKAIDDGVKEGLQSGLKTGLSDAFKSDSVQLSFDKLMQAGYDLGRADEKNGKPYRNFTQEHYARKGKL